MKAPFLGKSTAHKLSKPMIVFALLTLLMALMVGVAFAGKSTVGDYVWYDKDADGIQDAGEVGINGVVVNIYKDGKTTPKNGLLTAADFMSTTTTTVNPDPPLNLGWYDFKVDGGETYWVEIPASNFGAGKPLENYVHTSENTIDSNPTNQINPGGVSLQFDYNNADFGFAKAAIEVVKTAGAAADGATLYLKSPGGNVVYTYKVTNKGDTYLSNIPVRDDKGTPGNTADDITVCTITGPLAPNGTQTCTTTLNITADTTNIATVTGDATDSTGTKLPQYYDLVTGNPKFLSVSDTDNAVVDIVNPSIDIQKTVYLGHNSGVSCATAVEEVTGVIGAQVTYCFKVTNTGDTHLQVSVTDPNLNIPPNAVTPTPGLLAPSAVATYYYQTTITKDLLNTATATGNPTTAAGVDMPGISDVTDTDTAQVKYIRATIGDYVWYDTDADAYQDVNEPGLGNVTLALYKETTPGSNSYTLLRSTTTDSDGGYIFTDLEPAKYYVDVTDANGILTTFIHTTGPQSQIDPTPSITVASGDVYRDADFGYVRQPGGNAVIGDFVWYDGDGDGIQDPGEPGIPGIQVCATPTAGAPICATTDANGKYLITVPPGTYTVAPTNPPAGYTVTTPTSQTVTVVAGQQYLDADFGYDSNTALGTIGNQVWHDTTKNGTFAAGEPGIPGVSVGLIRDTNNNGTWDTGEPIIATTTTDTNGQYQFNGVPAGNYLVRISDTQNALDDYEPTTVIGGTADNTNKAIPYRIQNFPAGGNNQTADFGYVLRSVPNAGVIGNQVWYEIDVDGIYEPGEGEVGIAGVTMELLNSAGTTVLQTTTTGASGDYVFTSLAAGTYRVRVATNASNTAILGNYLPTLYVGGTADNTNKFDASNLTYTIVLPANGINVTADAGFTRKSIIGDFIWWDVDGDGIQDNDEPGIPGVDVQLFNDVNNNGQFDTGETQVGSTVTTDAKGLYEFKNLLPGNYVVKIPTSEFNAGGTLQNWTPTQINIGVNDDIDSDLKASREIDVSPLVLGEIDKSNDAGLVLATSYTVVKTLKTAEPVRTGDPVKFEIVIKNNGSGYLAVIPLVDSYDKNRLTYVNASPASDNNTDDGTINWADVTGTGQLAPNATLTVTTNFLAFGDTSSLTAQAPCNVAEKTCNVATVDDPKVDPDGPVGPLGPLQTLPDQTSSAPVKIINPTSVLLSDYAVQGGSDGVSIRWTTVSEAEIAGFNLYRQIDGGDMVKLNGAMIEAKRSGQSNGDQYGLQDGSNSFQFNVLYVLETMMLDGRSSQQVLGELAQGRIYLPMMQR